MSEANCVNGKCFIGGGTFTMGSPVGYGQDDAYPQREVTMSSFWMGQTEVSMGEYRKYIDSERQKALWAFDLSRILQLSTIAQELTERDCGEMNGNDDDYPVVCLTMQEKDDYCRAQGGDLPTAAQFEYAARFDEVDAADKIVIWGNGYTSTVPVTGGYQNRFGVFNLIGNVWESTRDAYDAHFYARMPGTDPYNPLTNPQEQFEELRGGSWSTGGWIAHSATTDRLESNPNYRSFITGFRCVWPAVSE